MNKRIIAIATLVIGVSGFLGYLYFLSPMVALNGMKTAIDSRDHEMFSSYIDFDRLKVSLKTELAVQAANSASEDEGGLGGLGAIAGVAIASQFVDALISPAAIRVAFSRAKNEPPDLKILKGVEQHLEINRDGWSRFFLRGDDEEKFIFERSGLSWKLIAMELPLDGQANAKPKSAIKPSTDIKNEPMFEDVPDEETGTGGLVPRSDIERDCSGGDEFACEMLDEMSPTDRFFQM